MGIICSLVPDTTSSTDIPVGLSSTILPVYVAGVLASFKNVSSSVYESVVHILPHTIKM